MDRARVEAFARDGVVAVPGAIDPGRCAAQREAVVARLRVDGIALDDAGGAGLVEVVGALRPPPSAAAAMWEAGDAALAAGLADDVTRAIDHTFGLGAWSLAPGAQVMPNLPCAGPPWQVPHEAWHVDEPSSPGRAAPWGLLAFALLDDVSAGGGATVAVAGSHRRLARLSAAPGALITTEVALAALDDPWWRALTGGARPLDGAHDDDGVALSIRELTGAAGDLVLLDPRCLHTISANRGDRARLVVRLVAARASAG